MANELVVRAWKDEEYRLSLSEAERALLPENPAGSLELSDAELDLVAGGGGKKKLEIKINCGITVIVCGVIGTIICDRETVKINVGS